MLKPSTFWADEAKSDLYRCAVKFWKLRSSPSNVGFYQTACELYKALSRLKTIELEDDSIKHLITKTLTSWSSVEGGERFIDVRDIDFEYFAIIDLVGFDGWKKVVLNDGPEEFREECRALIPGTIRDSELRERFQAVFEFEIFDTKTEWQVKCEAYSTFCELLARQVFGISDKVPVWESMLVDLQSGVESIEDFEQPREAKQHDAPTLLTIETEEEIHPPVADQFQHIRPAVFAYLNSGDDAEPRKAVLRITAKLKKEEFAKGQKGIWLKVLNEFKGRFKSSQSRQGIESITNCENVWRAYRRWLKYNYPGLDPSAEIDILYGHL